MKLSEATSANALLPGTLVSALVTAIVPSGLNIQVLGFFNGTIELFHLPGGIDSVKIGEKVRLLISRFVAIWRTLKLNPCR